MGIDERNRVETDLTNNGYLAWDPNEAYIHERILLTYRYFFYEQVRFPGNNALAPIPRAKIPSFIESRGVLLPLALYDTYVGRDMKGIVSVQFLAALNVFLGGDSELSVDVMSELFHNLSWQALTIDNDRYQIQFDTISMLTQSINQRLQRLVMEHRRQAKNLNDQIISQLMSKEVVEDEFEIENIEQNIVKDDDKTEYGAPSPPPFPRTEQQIDDDRRTETFENIKTELAKNQRDFEII